MANTNTFPPSHILYSNLSSPIWRGLAHGAPLSQSSHKEHAQEGNEFRRKLPYSLTQHIPNSLGQIPSPLWERTTKHPGARGHNGKLPTEDELMEEAGGREFLKPSPRPQINPFWKEVGECLPKGHS